MSKVEIDTAHFRGNFPESCELYAISSPDLVPPHQQTASETNEGSPWAMILPRTKLKPDCRHFFQLQNVDRVKYTHVMLMIYPDGGVKRVRLIGARDIGAPSTSEALAPTTNGESRPGDDPPVCLVTEIRDDPVGFEQSTLHGRCKPNIRGGSFE